MAAAETDSSNQSKEPTLILPVFGRYQSGDYARLAFRRARLPPTKL